MAPTILLPLGDTFSDTTQISVASAVLNPDAPPSGPADFVIKSVDSTTILRTFTAVASTRRSIDATAPCDPTNLPIGWEWDCPQVQDVWNFVWDGRDDSTNAVLSGDYPLVNTTTTANIGNLQVRDLELTSVTTTPALPVVLSPGIIPTANITARGLASGLPFPTIGSAELTDTTGTIVIDRFDFTSPEIDHMVTLTATSYALGNYVLRFDLEYNGVHRTRDIAVRIVAAQMNSATISSSSFSVYPYVDGYRDTVRLTVGGGTTVGRAIPVKGFIDLVYGGKVVASIRVNRSDATVEWNGRIGNKPTQPGKWSVRSRLKAASGVERVSRLLGIGVSVTGIGSASVNSSLTTVYPVRDGYRDTVNIRGSWTTNTGGLLPVTGTLAILRGSSVVVSKPITRASGAAFAWNGRWGSNVAPGTYTMRISVKGPEGNTVVKTKSIEVSGKQLVSVTTTGSKTVTAEYARDDCWTSDYASCDDGQTWTIGDSTYSSVTRYYNGVGSVIWAAHSIPLPAGTTSYQIETVTWTTDARYLLGLCYSDSANADDCPSSQRWAYPTLDYSGSTYYIPWTSLGASDESADFFIGSADWGSIYIARFIVNYKVTKKVLQ